MGAPHPATADGVTPAVGTVPDLEAGIERIAQQSALPAWPAADRPVMLGPATRAGKLLGVERTGDGKWSDTTDVAAKDPPHHNSAARVRLGLASPGQSLARPPPPQSRTQTAAWAQARIRSLGFVDKPAERGFPAGRSRDSKLISGMEIGVDSRAADGRGVVLLWSGPHQTGQAAWLADCRAMNSRGERMRKPEWGWMVL
jgi:hypothetical protein